MKRSDRLSFLCYRCYRCGRLITKLEILDIWEKAEKSGEMLFALCQCGSRHITPTNPKWWEEFTPRVLKLWALEVLPRLWKR